MILPFALPDSITAAPRESHPVEIQLPVLPYIFLSPRVRDSEFARSRCAYRLKCLFRQVLVCGSPSFAAVDCGASGPHKYVILAVDSDVVSDRTGREAPIS